MDVATLDEWLAGTQLAVWCPSDLRLFWLATGGGEVFESEAIYGPTGEPTLEPTLVEMNDWLREYGLPNRYVVFAKGYAVWAVDLLSRRYVQLEKADFRVTASFASFDDWYSDTIRAEYAEHYGLAP